MIHYCDIGTAVLAYRIFGDGPISIVIEGSISSCNAEWWDFCSKIEDHSVLVYDRAGYGKSTKSTLERTPENIVYELEQLIAGLPAEDKLILAGHSQGGLYASLFSIKNSSRIRGLLLLDPLSYTDNEFKTKLGPKEYSASGVDKSGTFKVGKFVTRIKLGFLLKGLLKKAPPFYYHEFSKDAEEYILRSLTGYNNYDTALKEYELSHESENLRRFTELKAPYDFPLFLITHSSEKMCKEIEYFGNTSKELANRIETIWQEIMEEMQSLSSKSTKITAENSSHYIHLCDEELLINTIADVMKR